MRRQRQTGGPRSKRTRDTLRLRALGWSRAQVQMAIIKHLYPQHGTDGPPWAKLAYERGWMSLYDYIQVPTVRVKTRLDFMYDNNPFFGMLKRG